MQPMLANLISNVSTDSDSLQPCGTFQLRDKQVSMSHQISCNICTLDNFNPLNSRGIIVVHQIKHSWYTGRWWVSCYIWYSEEKPGRAVATPSPLLAVPNVTAHPSTTSVPITVLPYDGPLLCSFNVAIKRLNYQSQLMQLNSSLIKSSSDTCRVASLATQHTTSAKLNDNSISLTLLASENAFNLHYTVQVCKVMSNTVSIPFHSVKYPIKLRNGSLHVLFRFWPE